MLTEYQPVMEEMKRINQTIDVKKKRKACFDNSYNLFEEKTKVQISYPSTNPVNGLTGRHYSGREWVRLFLYYYYYFYQDLVMV